MNNWSIQKKGKIIVRKIKCLYGKKVLLHLFQAIFVLKLIIKIF